MTPTAPLDTDTLTVGSLGVWSGVDSTTLYTVNWYHRLDSLGGGYGGAQSTSGAVSMATAQAFTQQLTSAEDGYRWRIGVIADNGTPGTEVFSDESAVVVAPIAVEMVVTVQ